MLSKAMCIFYLRNFALHQNNNQPTRRCHKFLSDFLWLCEYQRPTLYVRIWWGAQYMQYSSKKSAQPSFMSGFTISTIYCIVFTDAELYIVYLMHNACIKLQLFSSVEPNTVCIHKGFLSCISYYTGKHRSPNQHHTSIVFIPKYPCCFQVQPPVQAWSWLQCNVVWEWVVLQLTIRLHTCKTSFMSPKQYVQQVNSFWWYWWEH